MRLQQYLPFTVLKLGPSIPIIVWAVATVLTVYGIETIMNTLIMTSDEWKLQQYLPFTVLKPPSTPSNHI